MKIPNKILYKLASLAIVVAITSTSLISFAAPSNWAKDDYFLLNYEKLLSSELKNQNRLSQNITREEFAELAIKLYSKASSKDFNLIAKSTPFSDTDSEYVAMAYNVGLISGSSKTTFSPMDSLTREQLASIIYKELKLLGVDTSFDTNVEIADKSNISSWALEAVKFCVDSGILTSVSGDNIRPQDNASREQSISIISRVAKRYSWIEETENLEASSYKNINSFSVPVRSKTDLLIYIPDNSDIALRIYHNGIVDLTKTFDFKKLDKQVLDILDTHGLFNYETSFMVSEYLKDNWDNTNKTFEFESTKYFKNASILTSKPTGSYVEIKSGRYLEINIYE